LLAVCPTLQPEGPGLCIYVPQWQSGQLYPEAWGYLFVAFYDSQGYGGGILTRLHTESFIDIALLNNPRDGVFKSS
jgi:hypothetical protein